MEAAETDTALKSLNSKLLPGNPQSILHITSFLLIRFSQDSNPRAAWRKKKTHAYLERPDALPGDISFDRIYCFGVSLREISLSSPASLRDLSPPTNQPRATPVPPPSPILFSFFHSHLDNFVTDHQSAICNWFRLFPSSQRQD